MTSLNDSACFRPWHVPQIGSLDTFHQIMSPSPPLLFSPRTPILNSILKSPPVLQRESPSEQKSPVQAGLQEKLQKAIPYAFDTGVVCKANCSPVKKLRSVHKVTGERGNAKHGSVNRSVRNPVPPILSPDDLNIFSLKTSTATVSPSVLSPHSPLKNDSAMNPNKSSPKADIYKPQTVPISPEAGCSFIHQSRQPPTYAASPVFQPFIYGNSFVGPMPFSYGDRSITASIQRVLYPSEDSLHLSQACDVPDPPVVRPPSMENVERRNSQSNNNLDNSSDLAGTQPYSHGGPDPQVALPLAPSDPPSAESERTWPYMRSKSPYRETLTPAMLSIGSANAAVDNTDPFARCMKARKEDDFSNTFETDSDGKPIKYFVSDTQMMPVVSTQDETKSVSPSCDRLDIVDGKHESSGEAKPSMKKNRRKGRKPKRACEVVKSVLSAVENDVKKSSEYDFNDQDAEDHTKSDNDQTPNHKKPGEGKRYKLNHPVKCRFCDKIFWSHTGRYYHEAVHTGKWLFTCKYCKMGFMQRKAYDSHMRARHKPRVVEVLATTNEESLGLVELSEGEACEKTPVKKIAGVKNESAACTVTKTTQGEHNEN